mmetsp:Transcript_27502/g.74030  ORF Transcript_27502/g.74030 Transcript_27502/m.74030 type:complete len:255 (-) Transcript_27502:401-1165(-)
MGSTSVLGTRRSLVRSMRSSSPSSKRRLASGMARRLRGSRRLWNARRSAARPFSALGSCRRTLTKCLDADARASLSAAESTPSSSSSLSLSLSESGSALLRPARSSSSSSSSSSAYSLIQTSVDLASCRPRDFCARCRLEMSSARPDSSTSTSRAPSRERCMAFARSDAASLMSRLSRSMSTEAASLYLRSTSASPRACSGRRAPACCTRMAATCGLLSSASRMAGRPQRSSRDTLARPQMRRCAALRLPARTA